MPSFATNKRAYRNYLIVEDYEAGIKLIGLEVKAIREGKGNFDGSYIRIKNGEAWLVNFNLPPYSKAGVLEKYDSKRVRKLLLSKQEIISLQSKVEKSSYTIIPLKIYTSKNLLKLKIGLAKGKKKAEKKSDLIKKQEELQMQRALKGTYN